MEARQLMMDGAAGRTMADLGSKLKQAQQAGIQLSSIADATGVHRSLISNLANKGMAAINPNKIDALWKWVDEWDESKAGSLEEAEISPDGGFRQDLGMIHTDSLKAAIGFCARVIQTKQIGVLTGAPGTGKTTLASKLAEIYPNVVRIEAWLSMRLGDMLDDIAHGIGISLKGTLTAKTRQLEAALKGSNTILIVDEAEYLKKWTVEKLDVLRKIQDHTNIPLILMGTQALAHVVNRGDTTQLSSRMFTLQLGGARRGEIREVLKGYNMDAEAADALAAIASDTDHGGMRSYTLMLQLCLDAAKGGRITMDMLRDAKQYKPGLR